jgi:hypothetical protein
MGLKRMFERIDEAAGEDGVLGSLEGLGEAAAMAVKEAAMDTSESHERAWLLKKAHQELAIALDVAHRVLNRELDFPEDYRV